MFENNNNCFCSKRPLHKTKRHFTQGKNLNARKRGLNCILIFDSLYNKPDKVKTDEQGYKVKTANLLKVISYYNIMLKIYQ